MTDVARQSSTLLIDVSADRLHAYMRLALPPTAGLSVTLEDVLAEVERRGILAGEDLSARAAEFVQSVATAVAAAASGESAPPIEPVLLAQGVPAVEAVDGRFEPNEEVLGGGKPCEQADQVDYFAFNTIVTVAAGARLGRVIPPEPSQVGRDVYGRELRPRCARGTAVQIGSGIVTEGEGTVECLAAAPGRFVERFGRISVDPVLEIPGDLDFDTGNIDSCVDVHVRGTVRARFSVQTERDLYIDKVLEAAHVRTGGQLFVRGGVFGNEQSGSIDVGGNATVHLLNEAVLNAGGDLLISREILNSRVTLRGRLVAPQSTIIGGTLYARCGGEVCVLGSDAAVTTPLSIGISVNVLRHIRQREIQIRTLQKSAEQIRETLKPLIANLKRLNPAQRERATELMARADEFEIEVDRIRTEVDQLRAQHAPPEPATLLIQELAHPGVTLTVDAREVALHDRLHGPVRIEIRPVQGASEVVAVNQRTASVTVLPSCETDLNLPPTEPLPKEVSQEKPHDVVDRPPAA